MPTVGMTKNVVHCPGCCGSGCTTAGSLSFLHLHPDVRQSHDSSPLPFILPPLPQAHPLSSPAMPSLALALSLLFLPTLSFAAEPIHVPLTRRASSAVPFDPNEEALKLRLRYGFVSSDDVPPSSRRRRAPIRRASSAGIPITNQVCPRYSFLAL